MGENARQTKPCQTCLFSWHIWQGYVEVCSGKALASLDQTKLGCSFDGGPATIDVELIVDTLGVGANRAQADHEFPGDLRPRKLGVEQAEHLELALAERFREC